jgi:hypothetical protein
MLFSLVNMNPELCPVKMLDEESASGSVARSL